MDEESLAALLARADQAVSAPAVVEAMPTVSAPELTGGDVATGFLRSAAAGPTFGLSQQLEAAARAPFTEQTYGEELANIRQQQRAFESEYPGSALGTEIATGLLLNPLGALGAVGKGAQAARKATSIAKPIQRLLQAERIAKPAAAVGRFIESKPGGIVASRLLSYPSVQAALESAIRTEGTAEEKAMAAGLGAGVGSALGYLGGAVGRKLSKLDTEADRLLLSSYDITGADVKKLVKKQAATGKVVTSIDDIPLPETIRAFEKADVIKRTNDKAENLVSVLQYQNKIGRSLEPVLEEANRVVDAFPDFQKSATDRYIGSLSGKAREKAQKIALEERDAIINQFTNGGDLLDLQRAKVGLNYTYDASPLTPSVQKALREDLRREIEMRVGQAVDEGRTSRDLLAQLKSLNTEYGKAAEVKDIFAQRLGSELGGDVVEDTFMSMRTTGGAGTALQMATQSGNILPAVAGGILTAARVPEAKRELADILTDPMFRVGASSVGRVLEAAPLVRGGARAYQQFGTEIPQAQEEQAGKVRMAEQVIAQQAAQAPLMEELRMLRQALESRAGTTTPTETPREEEPRAQMKPMALKRNASVEQRIERFTQEDPIVQSIIYQESRGKLGQKSQAGAVGLMQLKTAAAKDMGVKDRLDPEQNLSGGARYYESLLKQFGDEELALAAYNWGMGNVSKKLKELERKGREQSWSNIVKYFGVPSETEKYVDEVLRRRSEIAQNPTAFWTKNLRA
jgi:soluble lytic murein transglycosylase-like protein